MNPKTDKDSDPRKDGWCEACLRLKLRNGTCDNCKEGPVYKSGFCFLCTPRRVVDPGEGGVVIVLIDPNGIEREVVRHVKTLNRMREKRDFRPNGKRIMEYRTRDVIIRHVSRLGWCSERLIG